MALQSPITWSTIEDAIYDWAVAATGITVDWAEDRPERQYPYVTLKSSDLLPIAHRAEILDKTNLANPAGEEIEQTAARDFEFVISVQCRTRYDAPGVSARHYLQSAMAALDLPTQRSALRIAGAIVVEAEPILDLDEDINAQWTSGASMDVRFRTLGSVVEKTGYIAKIGVTGTFKDVDGSTIVTYTEDI
jgi:hypothetical protein